jgi:hypothetical protein
VNVFFFKSLFNQFLQVGSDPGLVLDPNADKFSNKKDGIANPRGLFISGGMAFETKVEISFPPHSSTSSSLSSPAFNLSF